MATVTGDNGDNQLNGTNDPATGDSITGDAGNDTVFAGQGDDTIDGGTGNDSIQGDEGNDSIDGGSGTDTIEGGVGDDTIQGMDGADVIDGGQGDGESMPGGASDNDVIFGGAGNDTITGNVGNDSIDGGADNDSLSGGEGADTIAGGTGNDSIDGGTGNDSIDGGSGTDTIEGGVGDDTIHGMDGADVIDGGQGDGESMPGGASDGDVIFGGAGNDTITGNVGDDSIDGGADDDDLSGGEGADTIAGGTGNDQIDFTDTDNATDTFVVSDGDGSDTITGFSGPVSDGMGGYTSEDQFDVNGLTDANGNPVNAFDVVVTDDGAGNAVLTFPDGTSTTLIGVAPSQVDTPAELNAMGIPCFIAGTLIETECGPRKVEELEVGDRVLTRDHGMQTIRWAGQRTVAAHGDLAPIRIKAGTFGNSRDLLVSPQHRVLVTGGMAELYYGETEILVPAKALLNDRTVLRQPAPAISYCHILFDGHEVILSEGAWTESFHPGDVALNAVGDAAREEILHIFPELSEGIGDGFACARPTLKVSQGRILASMI